MAIKLITTLAATGIGFIYGGPAGALAGAAAGAGVGNLFGGASNALNTVTKDATQNLNAAEQALVQGIQKTADVAVATIEKVGKVWAPLYLCSLWASLASSQAQSNFDWYKLNCREATISGGEEILCYADIGVGCIAFATAGFALLNVGLRLWSLDFSSSTKEKNA